MGIMLGGFDRMGEGDSKKMQKFVLPVNKKSLKFVEHLQNESLTLKLFNSLPYQSVQK